MTTHPTIPIRPLPPVPTVERCPDVNCGAPLRPDGKANHVVGCMDTPLQLEPWQRELLDRVLAGDRVMISYPPRRPQFVGLVSEVMFHQMVYGCHVEVVPLGDRGVTWRCAAGDACPQVRAATP